MLKSRFGVGLLAVGLLLAGCYPPPNSQDEEKNPYYLAGKDRVAARDYQGGIEAFEKALEVNPRSALVHWELGVLHEQRLNDFPAAIYHYNKVIKLRPNGSYPAENAKQRLPGCKLEMIKNDTLATLNPSEMRKIDALRQENQLLQDKLQAWDGWWKQNGPNVQRALAYIQSGRASSSFDHASPPTPAGPAAVSSGNDHPRPSSSRNDSPARRAKTHVVKRGETLFSLSRQYGVSLNQFMDANPGLNPRKIKVGQKVNLP